MKATLNWLREYVDITIPLPELVNKLTMAGLETEIEEVTGSNWDNVLVGQITAVNPHPNADRLTLPEVDLGTERVSVVCGAPNLRVGDKIAFARVGARLIDGHTGESAILKTAKIRGIVSSGMVCSEKELGISDRHEGILVLPDDAPIGTPLADYMGDTIINLDITPNRPDCLSVIGIAREIAAMTGQKMHIPEITYEEAGLPIQQQVNIEITAPDLCPRYCASLITDVKLGDSPQWMQQRLLACGMRPISNIVDITNYVMLEYGEPLHSFDYASIGDKKIIVRRAAKGEKIYTLDGVERALTENMLVIADIDWPVAIAGVMGGANSEVTENTTSILLEAASFKAASIYYTSRTLRLASEACMRFERNISSELTIPALKRATQLLVEYAGGTAAKGIIDVYPGKKESEPIKISTNSTKRVLGVDFSLARITDTLNSLGFECKANSDTEALVTSPYWRTDINLEVDLIEEVARIIGYDEIPMTMVPQPIPPHNPEQIIDFKRKILNIMTGFGFKELSTYSLTSLEILNKLSTEPHPVDPPPIRMSNPMTTEQEYLRTSLRGNLLTALVENRKHENGAINIFEIGRVYNRLDGDLPEETETLCGVISGSRIEESWQGGIEKIDFFTVKGIVESLFERLGIEADFQEHSDHGLHPTKQAAIIAGDRIVGVIGELHPRVRDNFDITDMVCLFDINLPLLLPSVVIDKMFQPIPRFPSVVRDIALVVDTGITHQKIVNIINSFPLVEQVNIFDVYSGEQVPSGKKSLAYRITFQSPTHTLTDEEVNKVQQQILNRLTHDIDAVIRG